MIKNTPDNQKFWTEVELNFVQTYTEETESDYNFKIPLDILKTYYEVCTYLNNEGLCTIATNTSVPMVHIMKRNFLRYKELQPEEIKNYLTIIECLVKSKSFRNIFDQQVKDRIVHFFNDNKEMFSLSNFKKLSIALQNFKYSKNSEQYKLLEASIHDRFN